MLTEGQILRLGKLDMAHWSAFWESLHLLFLFNLYLISLISSMFHSHPTGCQAVCHHDIGYRCSSWCQVQSPHLSHLSPLQPIYLSPSLLAEISTCQTFCLLFLLNVCLLTYLLYTYSIYSVYDVKLAVMLMRSFGHRACACLYLLLFAHTLRGGFKTQPPVDRRFRPVLGGCHCLEQ